METLAEQFTQKSRLTEKEQQQILKEKIDANSVKQMRTRIKQEIGKLVKQNGKQKK